MANNITFYEAGGLRFALRWTHGDKKRTRRAVPTQAEIDADPLGCEQRLADYMDDRLRECIVGIEGFTDESGAVRAWQPDLLDELPADVVDDLIQQLLSRRRDPERPEDPT